MTAPSPSPTDLLDAARDVLRRESEAIAQMIHLVGPEFVEAVQRVHRSRGLIVVTGMGKAGLIGAKISATFASTGTRSIFLHPAEAVHGDLGRIHQDDLVLALSLSGTTREIVRLLDPIKRIGAPLVAITSSGESPLGQHADVTIEIGSVVEACPLGLAPSTSTSVMLAVGDALALTVMRLRDFSHGDFARFHPAGALGRQLLLVEEVMRSGEDNPLVQSGTALREAVEVMTETRAGAVIVVDERRCLHGVYTDGDLRRHLLRGVDGRAFDIDGFTVDDVMTRDATSIQHDRLATEAIRLMRERQFDQLPVVDAQRQVVGLLDVQDLMLVEHI